MNHVVKSSIKAKTKTLAKEPKKKDQQNKKEAKARRIELISSNLKLQQCELQQT